MKPLEAAHRRRRLTLLLDKRGVGASAGVVPDNGTDMARDVLRFIDALGLEQVDVLGFSLVGYIAQELAPLRPRLVRGSCSPELRRRAPRRC